MRGQQLICLYMCHIHVDMRWRAGKVPFLCTFLLTVSLEALGCGRLSMKERQTAQEPGGHRVKYLQLHHARV